MGIIKEINMDKMDVIYCIIYGLAIITTIIGVLFN